MSWLSKHVLPQLKKIKPLKVVGQATGVTSLADAAKRIGSAVKSAAQSASEEVQRVARDEEVSIAEASARVAERAAGAARAATRLPDTKTVILVAGAIVVVFLLMRRK